MMYNQMGDGWRVPKRVIINILERNFKALITNRKAKNGDEVPGLNHIFFIIDDSSCLKKKIDM